MRNADDVRRFVRELGVKFGDGDDWIKAGPLKILVDGGIHWGTTYLREPYGPKRAKFYVLDDPNYRGDMKYTVDEMAEVFAEGHKLGWQMCCHVTGDGGVDRVLDALEMRQSAGPAGRPAIHPAARLFPGQGRHRTVQAAGRVRRHAPLPLLQGLRRDGRGLRPGLGRAFHWAGRLAPRRRAHRAEQRSHGRARSRRGHEFLQPHAADVRGRQPQERKGPHLRPAAEALADRGPARGDRSWPPI